MAAVQDCRKVLNSNTAAIQESYIKGVIDITTAKTLYNKELQDYAKCIGADMSSLSIPNPFEEDEPIVNYRFIVPFTIKQGTVKTFFHVGDIVKGEKLSNENVRIAFNGVSYELDKSYFEETSDKVTIITSETPAEIRRMKSMYSTGEKIAIGFLIFFAFLVFIKLLKII